MSAFRGIFTALFLAALLWFGIAFVCWLGWQVVIGLVAR